MFEVEYLTDQNDQPKAVVIPIALWRQLFPHAEPSAEAFAESIEDCCLGKAMDEAKDSPVLSRDKALALLEKLRSQCQ